MLAHRQNIIKRRQALVVRSQDYRVQIKRNFEQLRPRVEFVATALRLINSLRSKISVMGGIAALLLVRRRGTVSSWFKRAWIFWQLVRRLRNR